LDFTIEAWVWLREHKDLERQQVFAADLQPNDDIVLVADLEDSGATANITRIFIRTDAALRWVDGPVIPPRLWTHLAATWDDSTGTAILYVNGIQVGTDTWGGETLNAPSENTSGIGAAADGLTARISGYIRDVRIWDDVRTPAEILANYTQQLTGAESNFKYYWKLDEGTGTTATDSASNNDGTISGTEWGLIKSPFWTSIKDDVLIRQGVRATYGIKRNGPLDRLARTGTMDFRLRNDDGNSGGLEGYYSPDHANVRSGFELGNDTRLKITYSGSTRYKWMGQLASITPEPGQFRGRQTHCRSVDWFDFAAKRKTQLLEVAFDQRADEGIAELLKGVELTPSASSLATGQDTFPTVFDQARDERTTIMRELNNLVMSELGYLYPKSDELTGGVITFEDRHARPKTTTSVASFSDSMVRLVAERSTKDIFNRIKADAHPRETSDSASILFTLQDTPFVGAGACAFFEGRYTDPLERGTLRVAGASMVTPASDTDYTMHTKEDGTGLNRTATFDVTASYGGNSVRYAIRNNSKVGAFITLLQARGRMITVKEPIQTEKMDSDSSDAYGDQELRLRMQYQDSFLVSEDAANWLLESWKDPESYIRRVSFNANVNDDLMKQALWREPGDRITIAETITGIDKDYFIQGVELKVRERDIFDVSWITTRADTTEFWILGVVGRSELDQTTLLGY
jgi:hypothetical protein